MTNPSPSLGRATATLLAGGAAAQALPLLLGPWVARLYTPEQFGHYVAFAAVAANLAVVACARYEFALPMVPDDDDCEALMALCLRCLLASVAVITLLSAWPGTQGVLAQAAWLGPAVLALGAAQLFNMHATRSQRFGALAVGRLVQHGGGAVLQVVAGLTLAGTAGLVLGPLAAAILAALGLAWGAGIHWRRIGRVPMVRVKVAARAHRDFPLLNAPHAFSAALQDTLTVALIMAMTGDMAAGLWGLALRYLKAPATWVGSAVSQALYPKLASASHAQAQAAVRQVMGLLALAALPLAGVLLIAGPTLFAWAFGERWRGAGELARALAPYIALHFVASPLAVVTMAWQAQAWALRLALVGQALFLLALAAGLFWGDLVAAAWCVSASMSLYFAWYFWKLATWPDPALAKA